MTEPAHRTILLFDIEKFGQRDDVEQSFMRRMLYAVLQETLQSAGIEQMDQRTEDRGDCVMVLINPTVPKGRLLRALLTETPALLRSNNRLAASSAQVRLRVVLASGEVALQELGSALGGAVGWDLNQAFRLLNSEELRSALRERSAQSVLCVSESVYRGIVRHGHHGVTPEEFHEVSVMGKEGSLAAWIHGTPVPVRSPENGSEAAAAPAEQNVFAEPATTRSGTYFLGGAPSFGGNYIAGDQHVVSGGTVNGDVSGGGSR